MLLRGNCRRSARLWPVGMDLSPVRMPGEMTETRLDLLAIVTAIAPANLAIPRETWPVVWDGAEVRAVN